MFSFCAALRGHVHFLCHQNICCRALAYIESEYHLLCSSTRLIRHPLLIHYLQAPLIRQLLIALIIFVLRPSYYLCPPLAYVNFFRIICPQRIFPNPSFNLYYCSTFRAFIYIFRIEVIYYIFPHSRIIIIAGLSTLKLFKVNAQFLMAMRTAYISDL